MQITTALLEAHRAGVADGITIKLTRVGGITPAALLRDVAVELGIGVTVEDASGCDLADTAFAHLNASTPVQFRVHTVDFDSWVTVTHERRPVAAPRVELGSSGRRAGLRADPARRPVLRSFVDVSL